MSDKHVWMNLVAGGIHVSVNWWIEGSFDIWNAFKESLPLRQGPLQILCKQNVLKSTIFVIVFAMPIFIAVILPLAVVYYLVQKIYVMTARQVKRMESIARYTARIPAHIMAHMLFIPATVLAVIPTMLRSPIYTHFSETITGGPTFRANEWYQLYFQMLKWYIAIIMLKIC